MYPSLKAELAAREGDLRLCLLLGIAAWFLFLDHVPHNVVGQLTMRNFGFSGATDLFVFVGGYTAAILYGRMMLERGFVVTATRIFKRLWQLYAAYIVLFVIYIDLIGYVARQSAAPALIGEFNVTGIVDHTIRTLIHGLLLQAKPLNLDVLAWSAGRISPWRRRLVSTSRPVNSTGTCLRFRMDGGISTRSAGNSCSCSAPGWH
jgi:hypothetical protein